MKKMIFKIMARTLIIIDFIIIFYIITGAVNSYFHGYTSSTQYPNTLYWIDEDLNGFSAVVFYFKLLFSFKYLGEIFIPILMVCIAYQIVYFAYIRKKLKEDK